MAKLSARMLRYHITLLRGRFSYFSLWTNRFLTRKASIDSRSMTRGSSLHPRKSKTSNSTPSTNSDRPNNFSSRPVLPGCLAATELGPFGSLEFLRRYTHCSAESSSDFLINRDRYILSHLDAYRSAIHDVSIQITGGAFAGHVEKQVTVVHERDRILSLPPPMKHG